MKTILVHSFNLLAGGIERWAIMLASRLPEYRWRFWCPDGTSPVASVVADLEAIGPVFCGPNNWAAACAGADVLLASGWVPDAHKFRGTAVAVSHGSGDFTAGQMQQLQWVDHYVAVSAAAAAAVPNHRPCHVIWNGVDLDRCRPQLGREEIRRQWGLEPSQMAIGHVGRLSLEKRPGLLIRAVHQLQKRGVDAVAVWVGDGAEKRNAERLAKCWGVQLVLPGVMANVGDAFAALDHYVVPSDQEGFCLSGVEAMAAGLPVTATAVGVFPEILQTFGPGVRLVPVNCSDVHLASAILAGRDVDRGRAVALEYFGADVMAENWKQFLDGLQPLQAGPRMMPMGAAAC